MNKTRKVRGGKLNMKGFMNKAKTFKNTATMKARNLGSMAVQKAKNVGQTLKNKYNQARLQMKTPGTPTMNGGGFMNQARALYGELKDSGLINQARNYATRKATNFGQKLQNKYNQYKTRRMLNNEFNNRPNMAGMTPGAASRNLMGVANAQARRRQMRNQYRRNGYSGRNAYNAASMITGFF